ncbi:MAG: DNA alkylation repair protein [Bacteroidales bacterium]|nr:DNA alkylation repair protein [Bacteroidales bacterium]
MNVSANDILDCLTAMADPGQTRQLMRFFKTGKGDYGEGDRFMGLRVPQTRAVVREAAHRVSLPEIEKLLYSPWHEARLAGFLLLEAEMKAALPGRRKGIPADTPQKAARRDAIARFFLRHARQANNWDLVDIPCRGILGEWLMHPGADGNLPSRDILDRLALSDNLWEQRIAIVTTWRFIRERQFADTLRLATLLLGHPHDLIHKAVGWMLREVGKKDEGVLLDYLEEHHAAMSRTTLRYAIERLPHPLRLAWLRH